MFRNPYLIDEKKEVNKKSLLSALSQRKNSFQTILGLREVWEFCDFSENFEIFFMFRPPFCTGEKKVKTTKNHI